MSVPWVPPFFCRIVNEGGTAIRHRPLEGAIFLLVIDSMVEKDERRHTASPGGGKENTHDSIGSGSRIVCIGVVVNFVGR